MIVYGDPQYEETFPVLWQRLGSRITVLGGTVALDDARGLLVQAGQMEQAASDGLPSLLAPAVAEALISQCCALTDQAAAVFLQCRRGSPGVTAELAAMRQALESVHPPDVRLTVKLPEGFAFYALYPEQYEAASRRWLADHATVASHRVVVVGIRSIGTTLSALVRAVLADGGWEAHRVTVRPGGHPFARDVEIKPTALNGAAWGLIVDEGPGLSGSSFAACAEALHRAGIARDRLCFFPGHGGEPGGAASERIRDWWANTPRYVTQPEALRWEGRSLVESLSERAAALCAAEGPFERVEDFGGGLWRAAVYPGSAAWPAVAAPFERPKYRITLGSAAAVLWKFAGFVSLPGGDAAEVIRARQEARAGWTPSPSGVCLGFVATPWAPGTPLTIADRSPALLGHIGRYIAAVAGPPMLATEQEAAWERLRHLTFWNIKEALGDDAAERTGALGLAALGWANEAGPPAYGDGRMAPHEWLRPPEGAILKTDSLGHDWDHTAVGRQPFAWDVAGALVEWQCDADDAAPLLAALRQTGLDVPAETLRFYRLAYAAFRMGQCALCAGMSASDLAEQARLTRACDAYRAVLVGLLDGAA